MTSSNHPRLRKPHALEKLGALAAVLASGVVACATEPIEKESDEPLGQVSQAVSSSWGLLANPGFDNQPVKGIYFFPGDPNPAAVPYFTVDPALARDANWTGSANAANRAAIMQDMRDTGANVIHGQYSGDNYEYHFVQNNKAAYADLWSSASTSGPLVLPVLENSTKPCPVGGCQLTDFTNLVFSVERDFTPPCYSEELSDPNANCPVRGTLTTGTAYVQPDRAANWIQSLAISIIMAGNHGKWARICDRNGSPRYAIQLSHAATPYMNKDYSFGHDAYSRNLDRIASQAEAAILAYLGTTAPQLGITSFPIGFILTPVPDSHAPNETNWTQHSGAYDLYYSVVKDDGDATCRTSPSSNVVAPNLRPNAAAPCASFLAILPYVSEIRKARACCSSHANASTLPGSKGWVDCNKERENSSSSSPMKVGVGLKEIATFKKQRTKWWVQTGIPYYIDVDPGFDNHNVARPGNAGELLPIWGDTGYLDDTWRNAQSELKGHQGDLFGPTPKGIVYHSWDSLTEGPIAINVNRRAWPTSEISLPIPWYGHSQGPSQFAAKSFGAERRTWLKDVFSVDPRLCDHYYYEGQIRKWHVFGAICEKYTEKNGELGSDGLAGGAALGKPTGDVGSSAYPNWSVQNFASGQIWYSSSSGAHEVHGGIYAKWNSLRTQSIDPKDLGPAVTDQLPAANSGGVFNRFQNGSIYWTPDTLGVGIWGSFLTRWGAIGWETSSLGYPQTDPLRTGPGWYQRFAKVGPGGGPTGVMYTKDIVNGPAFEVDNGDPALTWDNALDTHGRLGWEQPQGKLGFPTSLRSPNSAFCLNQGGYYQLFERGAIEMCPNRPVCAHLTGTSVCL